MHALTKRALELVSNTDPKIDARRNNTITTNNCFILSYRKIWIFLLVEGGRNTHQIDRQTKIYSQVFL